MYRVLHIDADQTARRAVLEALAESPLPFTVEAVPDRATLPPDLAGATVDAILLGTGSQAQALASLARWRQWFAAVPIILLTGSADLAFARQALRAGAQDVVTCHEPALAVLSRILLYAIERAAAEARGRLAKAEAEQLTLLLDALFAGTSDAFLETDADGTIIRAAPAAARTIGLDLPPPPSTYLAEHVPAAERARLTSFLAAGADATASLTMTVGRPGEAGASRLAELSPIALPGATAAGLRLYRVAEIEAAFAVAADDPPLPAAATRVQAPGASGQSAPAAPALAAAPGPSVARAAGEELGALDRLRQIATTVTWHGMTATGGDGSVVFLGADPESARQLQALGTSGREDLDLALAYDTLRVEGWRSMAEQHCPAPGERAVLEVSYATVTSRAHFERLLAAVQASSPSLVQRFVLALQGVPKGIHVPTLAKTIRAMGTSHGKPALQLPELETDYRGLELGQLALMILGIDDLRRALTRDARRVATFVGRARAEGCRTVVRGATGALAEALKNRLGVDMTVAS